jgi:hypothetical protein
MFLFKKIFAPLFLPLSVVIALLLVGLFLVGRHIAHIVKLRIHFRPFIETAGTAIPSPYDRFPPCCFR